MFRKKIDKKVSRIRRSLVLRMDGRRCMEKDGGKGSGNWGHAGRPGKVGGSAEGGGAHNRQTVKGGGFTSFSKHRKEAAKLHTISEDEAEVLSKVSDTHEGLRLVDKSGNHWKKYSLGGVYVCAETGEVRKFEAGDEVKVIVPNSMNPNYSFTKDDRDAMALNKERAKKSFSTDDKHKADDLFRPQSGELYKQCTTAEKNAFAFYTGSGYGPLNDAIREGDTSNTKLNTYAKNLTKALDRSELQQDTMLHRAITVAAAENLFGLPKGYLSSPEENAISMVGRVGTEDAFASCGAAEGTGFHKAVQLEIMAPKGTKGMYVEPFSTCGGGAKKGWDGESKQDHISSECEILLNRGCTFQITGYKTVADKYGNRKHVLQVAIIDQDHTNSKYSQAMAEKKKKPAKKAG